MIDEALFYERFLADVRRCAPGRRAVVLSVGRRLRGALGARPGERERRWALVVRAIRDLLRAGADRESPPARRLRDFVRENADLTVARDVAITDLVPRLRPAAVLAARRGRYVLFTTRADR